MAGFGVYIMSKDCFVVVMGLDESLLDADFLVLYVLCVDAEK